MPAKFIILLTAGAVGAAIYFSQSPITLNNAMASVDHTVAVADTNAIAVVELFTSEGCSSCPAADKVLGELPTMLPQSSAHVYLLAFHVDYWNYLGWKDLFSDAAYSQRQQAYDAQLVCSVYTPQMIVNGNQQFTGSNKQKALDAIQNALKKPARISINASWIVNANKSSLTVKYILHGDAANQLVNVALVEDETETDVKRGENSGKHLEHTNVVRAFSQSAAANSDGSQLLDIPAGLDISKMHILVYTQHTPDLTITGASIATSTQ